MYKIHVKGNLFYIDDLTSQIRYEGLAKEVRPKVLEINSDGFSFDNVNNWSSTKVIYFNEIDLTDADYSDIATFKGWYEQELGKSSPSDGGGVPPNLDDYLTKDVNETITSYKTFLSEPDKLAGIYMVDNRGGRSIYIDARTSTSQALFIDNMDGDGASIYGTGSGNDLKIMTSNKQGGYAILVDSNGNELFTVDKDGNTVTQGLMIKNAQRDDTQTRFLVIDSLGNVKYSLNSGSGYNPKIIINNGYDNFLKTNTTTLVMLRGRFLDYADSLTLLTSGDSTGMSVNILSKDFDLLRIEVTTNSVEQYINIVVNSPNNNEVSYFNVADNEIVVPKNGGSELEMWYKSDNSNDAVLTTGSFVASDIGDGWNEHGAYGGFQGFTKLTHKMTITNLSSPSTGYAYVSFSDEKEPSTNQFPVLSFNGNSLRIRGYDDGFIAQNIQVNIGDELTVIQELDKLTVLRNGSVIAVDNDTLRVNTVYVNFTAWRVTSFNNISTIIE